MPRANAAPCIKLALAIITFATSDWKRCNGMIGLYVEPDELIPLQIDRARKRNRLLPFFHSEWFNFLFASAVTKTTKGKMFKKLGIPMQEMAG